ncbi:MobV family relaxase, partial [Cetobacterium sp.]|uniref:MobV family relaxase n=1 Tax=Cetobacterium sp. TaxID=2071632 RepID=UPI003F67BF0B
MRFEKRKSVNVKGMELHNERKTENHSNTDIDLEKKYLNYDLVKCENYKKKIDEEINKRYKGQKAIRKDAVLCTEVLFTSDKDFFDKIGEEKEKIYFEKSLEFLERKFGKENIISAKVHKDESTPHLHAVIVPLHSDGSLSMKKFVDGKKDLAKLQDEFYEHISKEFPQMERGLSAKETKRKNLSVDEFKKATNYLENQIKDLQDEIKLKNKEIENLITLKEIEKGIKKNKLFTGFSIGENELKDLMGMASEKIENKNLAAKLEKISEAWEKEKQEKISLQKKFEKESNQKMDRDIHYKSMVRKVDEITEYTNIIEKKLLEKAPSL